MEIVKHKRDIKTFQEHRERLETIGACTDTSTPSSLGMKHLATRPKKQQLIEDRHQMVAKENKQLMERMTKLMVSKRSQPKYERHPSIHETGRKMEADRVNMENKLLLHRLKVVNPVLDRKKMKESWDRHLKIGANMRKKKMPPVDEVLRGLSSHGGGGHGGSRSLASKSKTVGDGFDSRSYISQLEGSVGEGSAASGGSPIKTMAEFRKHVISTKKMAASQAHLNSSMTQKSAGSGPSFEMSHGM